MSSDTPPDVWIDNHCHLGDEDDPAAVVDEAVAAGVVHLIDVGTSLDVSRACLSTARRFPAVSATAGVHPHDAVDGVDGLRDLLLEGRSDGSIVAVGECGLDYHYDHSPRDAQRVAFAEQIALAHELDLALVIHTRDAWDDTFALLDSEGMPPRTVFHCFTGGPAEAEASLERGAMLSISGIATFPSAPELQAAVASAPLERLMVETDALWLTPVPHRGQRNRSVHVRLVGEQVARLQDRPVAEVAAATTAAAIRFYGLDVGSTGADSNGADSNGADA